MSENTFLTTNYEPWKIKVREQLREKAILLHEFDKDRKGEKSFLAEPSIAEFYTCPSVDGTRRFCVIPSDIMVRNLIIDEEYTRSVVKEYSNYFGTNNPEDVLQALREQNSYSLLNDKQFRKFIEHEHYVWIVEYDDEGVVGDKYLRLDLFRHVIGNEKGKDFQGGLLHVLKHFCYCERDKDGNPRYYPLSFEDNRDTISGLHYVIRTIIEAFFMTPLEKDYNSTKGEYTAMVPHKNHTLIAVFYKNKQAGVYFLNSLHIKDI